MYRPVEASMISCPEIVITNAVIVEMITVSISGSSNDTKPLVVGSFVLTAACAIAAEPTPASLENARV